MLFDDTWRKIEENRTKSINCIPFGFPRFEEYLPGIIKKHYYIITANSGVGKSQITDFMFLYQPFNYHLLNPDINLKIFYFSLEMDKESKLIAGMSKRLYEKYKLRVEPNQILSFNKNKLPSYLYKALYQTREYFERMESVVNIIDDQLTPEEINKFVETYALRNGKLSHKRIDDKEIIDSYIPYRDEYTIFITDHVAELTLGKHHNIKDAIEAHSNNNRINRNRYGYTFVDVQQQVASKEDQEFYQGLSIITKLEPSLQGLGENKLTQRKANIVLGLFAPHRFELPDYRGYNIKILQDNFRSLSILKNRNGISNVHVGLYFDGGTNFFQELPPYKEMTPEIYTELVSRTRTKK